MSNPFDIDSEVSSAKLHSRSSDSVSLAFLFYLITMAAIIAACTKLLIGNELASWPIVWTAVFAGAVICGMLGTVISYRQSRNVSGTSLGGILGAIVGAVAGLVSLIAPGHYLNLMSIAFGGSFILILAMLFMARFQKQPNA